MNVRDIVRKAWQVTQVHLKKLIWYGAVPAFFSTLVSSTYLAYQYNAFKNAAALAGHEGVGLVKDINIAWDIISAHPKLTVVFVILGILVILGYILIPPIFRGTLIHALMKIKNYESIEGSMEVGVRRFFPMFEFALVSGVFSIITIFTESSFILRWWGESVFFILLPVLLFITAIGLIASFLFTYAEYFIVLQDHRLIKSIGESVILVISNMRKTILIFILMLLIGARIILNVLLILFIPMGVVLITGYLATTYLQTVGIVILSIFALAVLLVTSYLMGLFNVFATAVWVFTYSVLVEKSQPEIKDVDLGEVKAEEAPSS
jgi:hypothetical protein